MNSVKTNRSLLAYIILTVITFGLYGIWFIYKMKEDVNTICREDGKNTPGLIVLVILTVITCGIYSLVWYYQICERIGNYQTRRNMSPDINGVKYLLWSIVGSFVCGIGGFVAMYLLIKGLNSIALRYVAEAANGGARRPSTNNSSNTGSSNTGSSNTGSGSGSRGRLSDFADSNSGSDSFGNGNSRGGSDSFGNGSSRGGSDSFGNGGSSSNSGKTDSFGNPIN